jgi:hypothetical protein
LGVIKSSPALHRVVEPVPGVERVVSAVTAVVALSRARPPERESFPPPPMSVSPARFPSRKSALGLIMIRAADERVVAVSLPHPREGPSRPSLAGTRFFPSLPAV